MTDHICIEGLRLNCTIGVLPDERTSVQPIEFDLDLGLDLHDAGRTGRISETIDYSQVGRQIDALVQFRRFRLIESAAEEVGAMLFGLYPKVQTLRLRLRKPRALASQGAVASVALERSRSDYPVRHEVSRFGKVDILLETRDAGLYLLHVAPGRAIPRHHHAVMRELEWLVSGRLHRNGMPLSLLEHVAWPRGQTHEYTNESDEWATLFCCDCPPFIREDEIETTPRASS